MGRERRFLNFVNFAEAAKAGIERRDGRDEDSIMHEQRREAGGQASTEKRGHERRGDERNRWHRDA